MAQFDFMRARSTGPGKNVQDGVKAIGSSATQPSTLQQVGRSGGEGGGVQSSITQAFGAAGAADPKSRQVYGGPASGGAGSMGLLAHTAIGQRQMLGSNMATSSSAGGQPSNMQPTAVGLQAGRSGSGGGGVQSAITQRFNEAGAADPRSRQVYGGGMSSSAGAATDPSMSGRQLLSSPQGMTSQRTTAASGMPDPSTAWPSPYSPTQSTWSPTGQTQAMEPWRQGNYGPAGGMQGGDQTKGQGTSYNPYPESTPVGGVFGMWGPNADGSGGWTNSQDFWRDEANREGMNAQVNTLLPWANYYSQNQQWAQEAATAQNRWETENAQNWAQNQFGMDLSSRQQYANEWQAQEAANQWWNQFGFESDLANRRFGMEEQAQGFNQGMANRQFGLEQQRFGLQEQQQAFQQQYQRSQLQIEQAYRTGQISNERYNYETNRLAQQAQQAQQQAELNWAREQYGMGLGWEQQQFGQTMDWQRQQFGAEQALTREQMAQQAALERERMAQNERLAIIQATGGRQSMPSARWNRNW